MTTLKERREIRFAAMREQLRADGGEERRFARRRPLWRMRQTDRDVEIRAMGPQVPLSCEAVEAYGRLFAGMPSKHSEAERRCKAWPDILDFRQRRLAEIMESE